MCQSAGRQMLAQGREVSGKTLGLVGFGSIGQLTSIAVSPEAFASCAIAGSNFTVTHQNSPSWRTAVSVPVQSTWPSTKWPPMRKGNSPKPTWCSPAG